MLECTGATPRSLDTSPPAPLGVPATTIEAAAVAPLSDARLRAVSLEDHLGERTSETEDGSRTEGTDVSPLASTESPMPRPLARNVTLEFGDSVGERATRAALNRAAAIGEGRIDPRAVVAVERAAMAKLQNPRVVRVLNIIVRFFVWFSWNDDDTRNISKPLDVSRIAPIVLCTLFAVWLSR